MSDNERARALLREAWATTGRPFNPEIAKEMADALRDAIKRVSVLFERYEFKVFVDGLDNSTWISIPGGGVRNVVVSDGSRGRLEMRVHDMNGGPPTPNLKGLCSYDVAEKRFYGPRLPDAPDGSMRFKPIEDAIVAEILRLLTAPAEPPAW